MDRGAIVEMAAHAVVSAWVANGSSVEAVKGVCEENGVEYTEKLFFEVAELAGRKWRETSAAARAL